MPGQANAQRHTAIATKAVQHRAPAIEDNIPGIAFKSTQLGPYIDPTLAAATLIAVAEEFVIEVGGEHRTLAAHYSGGVLPVKGDKVYIIVASNLLTTTAGANVKFGIVDRIYDGAAWVNANVVGEF